MVKNVPKTVGGPDRPTVRAGKQILDIITSGMYSNSLMAIREYVQNAVDSMDEAARLGMMNAEDGRVDLRLEGRDRSISICDNGVGVPAGREPDVLCTIGVSSKAMGTSRGFRGIGRLGGIGYCDKVIFETRSSKKEPISIVTWDAKRLRNECRPDGATTDAARVIEDVVSLVHRAALPGDGEHFFRVTMQGVHRFHRDDLMSVSAVRSYISQVAPVPFDFNGFPLAMKINTHLVAMDGYRAYPLYVEGQQVFRPHAEVFPVSGKSTDKIDDVVSFDVLGRNGQEIGRGWYAKMGYLASIPPSVGMRGIRVRQGNIEVGDEHFLAEFFAERRFATWHVGEIHVNYALKVNARRDGFEQSPDFEAILEQANLLGRHLSHVCRAASKARSRKISTSRTLAKVESMARQAFFLTEEHVTSSVSAAEAMLSKLEHSLDGVDGSEEIRKRIVRAQTAIGRLRRNPPLLDGILDGRSLRHKSHKDLVRSIAGAILQHHPSQHSAEALIRTVLQPYIKPGITL